MRLTDKSYRQLAQTFGFGNAGGARTADAGFAAKIVAAYKTRAFETAVGDSDNDLRLAMNFRREIADLSAGDGGSWYSVLGSKPLRQVFEKALGLPAEFAQIDIDQQRDVLADKSAALFGNDDLTVYQDPAAVERLVDRFLARSQAEAGPSASTRGATALTLLQNASASASNGLLNLITSLS